MQRIVTPLEYPGSHDQIVIRVRPTTNGFHIDENGESAFYAGMNGGDIESESVARWIEDLQVPVKFSEEIISAFAPNERLVAPYVFRVAEAAQQLHAIATSRVDRQTSDFKERVGQMIQEIALQNNFKLESEVELPIAGGLKADHVLFGNCPLIIIAATSPARLLEAEVIYMQYRAEQKTDHVLAVAENQNIVGKKQFERAQYYTDKSVIYNPSAFRQMIVTEAKQYAH